MLATGMEVAAERPTAVFLLEPGGQIMYASAVVVAGVGIRGTARRGAVG
jgi:hypothetical protein